MHEQNMREGPKILGERNSWKQQDFLPVKDGWALGIEVWGTTINLI